MSTSVVFNGTSYTVPAVGDANWGANVSNYLIAIASGCLQKTGGAFTLTADANFGSSFGLVVKYIKSVTANIASAGAVRLAVTDVMSWRNNANGADLSLSINGSDALLFNSIAIIDASSTQTLTNKSFSDSTCKFVNVSDATKTLIFSLGGMTTGKTLTLLSAATLSRTLTFPDATDTFAVLAAQQTLTNKIFSDSTVVFGNVSDTTKALAFSLGGATTGKTMTIASSHTNNQTLTLPDATDTIVGRATTDTLTNKTLTSPTITGMSSTAIATAAFRDTSAAFDVTTTYTSSAILTAARTLTIDMENVSNTIKIVPLSNFSTLTDGSANTVLSTLGSGSGYAWVSALSSSLNQYNVSVGNASNVATSTNTNLIGDVSASVLSQSYTVTNATPGVFTVASAPATGTTAYVTATQNGFTANTRYYVTNVSGTTFKLATTLANALAGTNIASSGTTAGTIVSGGFSLQSALAYPSYYGAITTYVPTIKSAIKTLSSAGYTILDYDGFDLINVTTGASQQTITLPAVANNTGRQITIKKVDSGAGTILISPNGGNIDGASSNTLNAQDSYVTLKSNGTNWFVTAVFDYVTAAASSSLSASTTWTGITGILIPPGKWSTSVFFTLVGSSTTFTAGNGCQASYINPAGTGSLGSTMIQGYPGVTGSSTSASVFTGALSEIERFTSATQTSCNLWAVYTGTNPVGYAAQRSLRVG